MMRGNIVEDCNDFLSNNRPGQFSSNEIPRTGEFVLTWFVHPLWGPNPNVISLLIWLHSRRVLSMILLADMTILVLVIIGGGNVVYLVLLMIIIDIFLFIFIMYS